jgi:hypothetical protein
MQYNIILRLVLATIVAVKKTLSIKKRNEMVFREVNVVQLRHYP